MTDRHLDNAALIDKEELTARYQVKSLVFQPAKRNIRFGQEVAGTASRVEEGQLGELHSESLRPFVTGFRNFYSFYFLKFLSKLIKEQRVDDLMDIFNRGIMHTSAAARFGVQRRFKNCAENSGTDLRPIEIFACFTQQQVTNFLCEIGNFNVLIGKKTAVDIRERGQTFIHIRVTIFNPSIKNLEKVDQGAANITGRKAFYIVMEFKMFSEDT